MATIPVQFVYLTGLKQEIFRNVRLAGNWDSDGRYSNQWSIVPMQQTIGEDECPSFKTSVNFDATQVGWRFRWGVMLDGPAGSNQSGIVTEIKDHTSTDRYRTFELKAADGSGSMQEERYYLTHCRRLGAQKHYKKGQNGPGIRFAVWAPNAQEVEVVFGTIWDSDDPRRSPSDGPLPTERIAGGYIANDGRGMHPTMGPFKMLRQEDGTWVTEDTFPALSDFAKFDHRPYMFKVTKDDGTVVYRTDLYSRCQIGAGKDNPGGSAYYGSIRALDGTVSCSVVVDPDLVTKHFREPVWPEQEWLSQEDFWKAEFTEGRPVPKRVEDLVIYELHIGALGFGKPGPGTLEDAIQLLDYLEELGVNAVELLPMAEFGGGGENWGYATSQHFAIEYSGGGRDQYKFFVRECHRRGIAVIADVVYNHFAHNSERAEWLYDSDAHGKNIYYWYEGKSSDYPAFEQAAAHPDPNDRNPPQPGHGGYLDNLSTAYAPRYHEEMVRNLFISSAVALVEEFHIDGFRVDQTTSIHAYNVRHADGQPVPNANVFGAKLLREWTRTLKLIRPETMLMAEDHSEWDKVTVSPDEGGLGFDAAWYANFYHHLIGDTDKGSDYAKLLRTAGLGDNQALAMDYFAGALSTSGNRRVVYNESHDEAGNGRFTKRTIVTAVNEAPLLAETRRYAEARCRFALGMTMLSAGTPMFLFGEEIGAQIDFLYGKVVENKEDLVTIRATHGKQLFTFYSDLVHLRLNKSGLRSHHIDILHVHNPNRMLAFRRWNETEDFYVLASLNNQPFGSGYTVENPRLPDGSWKEIFNSDAQRYGGDNMGNLGAILPSSNGRIHAVVPANSFVVFEKV
jgi:1,4-alpha-glucan branching enzyme